MSKAVNMRLSDEVITIIEQTPGNTFTDKFNNLVMQLDLEFARKTKELKILNDKIEKSTVKMVNLDNYIRDVRTGLLRFM